MNKILVFLDEQRNVLRLKINVERLFEFLVGILVIFRQRRDIYYICEYIKLGRIVDRMEDRS